ncbi:MAG: hypothetical protein RL563_1889 [Pseudomonadota bacterium]|jgi:MSHA pilin protein MshD
MTARLESQTGVTLIELVISMLIISVALVGILSVIQLTSRHSADPLLQRQAVAIAESYLEEITAQAYSGSTSSGRANFDDVDDYNGLSDNGVHDQNGHAVSGLSQYTVTVAVAAATLADSIPAKQISVSVSASGLPTVSLVAYKAQY